MPDKPAPPAPSDPKTSPPPEPSAIEVEARFKNEELWRVGWVCSGFVALAIVSLIVIGEVLNLSEASGGDRVVANAVGLWMALVGVAVIGFGLFLAAAESTVPKGTIVSQSLEGRGLTGIPPAVVKEIVEALKSLKGAAAVLFVGLLLVAMSGFVAWQTADTDDPTDPSITTTTN